MQFQRVNPFDAVIVAPIFASAIGTRHHEAVHHGQEHRAFDRELELAPGQQRFDHGLAAGLLPEPLKQQRGADALAGEPLRIARRKLGQHHGALGVATDRAGQTLEFTGGDDDFLAAEVLDDALLGAAVFAHALDEVEVGVTVDVLLADKHAAISSEYDGDSSSKNPYSLHYLALHEFSVRNPPKVNQQLTPRQTLKSGLHCSSWA